MQDYIQILKQAEISPSQQRIKILEYLHNNHIHPTADNIYQTLKDDMPTLSKTTVYNTLKKLVNHDILVELNLFENEIRYEYNTCPHIHLRCIKCNNIIDIDRKFDLYVNSMLDGHKIIQHQVSLKGICKDCLKVGV